MQRNAQKASLPPIEVPPQASDPSTAVHVEHATSAGTIVRPPEERAKEREASAVNVLKQMSTADVIVIYLDPSLISPSKWHLRHTTTLTSRTYLDLKRSIEHSGGNMQPIEVRRIKDSQNGTQYELCSGMLRLAACAELGILVRAIVSDGIGAWDLFSHAQFTNEAQTQMSLLEDGLVFQTALDAGLFSSARKLAESLGRPLTYVSLALTLVRLPQTILDAFLRPTELKIVHAKALSAAIERDPDRVEDVAIQITRREVRPTTAETMRILVANGDLAARTTRHALKPQPAIEEVLRRSTNARALLDDLRSASSTITRRRTGGPG